MRQTRGAAVNTQMVPRYTSHPNVFWNVPHGSFGVNSRWVSTPSVGPSVRANYAPSYPNANFVDYGKCTT